MSGPAEAGVGPDERAVIAAQLGRTPRGLTGVAVRCPFGYPAVTESAPIFSGGVPNPTLLYVTCPSLDAVIGRGEGRGGVRDLRSACQQDARLREVLDEITRAYQRRRTTLHQEATVVSEHDPRLGAGIGGPGDPERASCLHAYAAALLAVIAGRLPVDDSRMVERAKQAWARFLPPVEEAWCSDCRCARWSMGERRAVIDVGTISVRLLVADVVDGRPWSVVREAEVTRLGRGLIPGGSLDPAARARTEEAVAGFARQARLQGVAEIRLAGTSATREASDGREFIRALGSQHGLKAEVVTGEREAQLAYSGVCLDVPDAVVLDVGGGSTELVTCSDGGRIVARSLELGASRATEKWVHSDPPLAEELDRVAGEAAREAARVRSLYGSATRRPEPRLVGVAGTVTTLAALSTGADRYDSAAIHLQTLSLDQIRGLLGRLAGMTTAERAELPCVQSGRAPVIVAGAAIVMAVLESLGYSELTVSERDLLDGLIMQE